MKAITLRVEPNTLESLDEEANKRDLSRSEYIRNIFRTRHEADKLRREHERIQAEYERQINELEDERDRLQRKLTATNARNDDVDELVEYVQEERDLQRRREERQDAPLWTRAKWYVFGRDRSDDGAG